MGALLLAVLLGVSHRCLFGVRSGVSRMPPRNMGMVSCLLVMSDLVMLGGFRVVSRNMRRVLGRLPVVLGCFSWTWGSPTPALPRWPVTCLPSPS